MPRRSQQTRDEEPGDRAPLSERSPSATLAPVEALPLDEREPSEQDEALPPNVREFLDWLIDQELSRWVKER